MASATASLTSSPISSQCSALSRPERSLLISQVNSSPGVRSYGTGSLVVRASDHKNNQPEDWKPPSDWDNAWTTYKKLSNNNSVSRSMLSQRRSSASSSSSATSSTSNSASSRSGTSDRKSSDSVGSSRRRSFFPDMEQYVSRNPTKVYAVSEEVDPMKAAERRALNAWTDMKFTYAGFGVVALMFVYMVVIVGPPPA